MFKKILLLFIFTIASSYGIEEANIKKVMDSKTKQVIQILKNKSLSQKQKEYKSIRVMDPIFHYPTMAKISLGKRWKTLSKKEKKAFIQAFERKMKYSYIDKLKLYKNQKVVTSKPKKVKKNRITLTTKIIGNNETYKIVNSFFKNKKNNQWYIYDVKLAGVSIIQTYRKQFKAFLKTKSFKQLLNSL
jgi:phospholipid transport system substrate-binding protein